MIFVSRDQPSAYNMPAMPTPPAFCRGRVVLVVPKATPGYAGGIKIAFSEE